MDASPGPEFQLTSYPMILAGPAAGNLTKKDHTSAPLPLTSLPFSSHSGEYGGTKYMNGLVVRSLTSPGRLEER